MQLQTETVILRDFTIWVERDNSAFHRCEVHIEPSRPVDELACAYISRQLDHGALSEHVMDWNPEYHRLEECFEVEAIPVFDRDKTRYNVLLDDKLVDITPMVWNEDDE